jgi:hypothetical protein
MSMEPHHPYINMEDGTPEVLTAAKQPVRITRRFHVQISGSMQDFESMGKTAATWAPVDNCHAELFGTDENTMSNGENNNGDISMAIANAVIVKATMLQSKSTFPVPLGLSCSVIPSREMTDTGEKFLATVLPEHTCSVPEILFEADATARQGIEWRSLYPQYNQTNLEQQGIMEVKGCPYVFVSQGHPAINLLRANSDLLGSDIDTMQKIDNEWFKVSRQVVMQCCQTLRTQVLNKVPSSDFTGFNMKIQRFQGVPWTSLPNEAFMTQGNLSAEAQQTAYANNLMKPCSYTARLELTYEINPPGGPA